MLTFPVNVPSNILQCLLDLMKNEAQHLCCFKNHVENFEKKKKILAAKQQDVKINIENASGVSRVKNEAQQWAHEADNLIEVDTKTRKKWFFGLFPNCYWQYQMGKELAEKTLEIEELLGRCSFNTVAGPADLPSIKYHYSPSFIHFESRKLKFQDLLEALEDENCNLIGLHGMGGTGKTSMAIEVGVKLEESKFHSVILLAMSNPPDFKMIRGEIARHLILTLEEGKEEEHSKAIWSRITNKKEKLLIILDDVWEEFDLIKDIGIPSSHQHKGCSVLIISRNSHVCEAMGCQRMFQLEMLTDKEALSLFLVHANTSSSRLKGMSCNIVKQCGGLPVAVVAVARALRNRPLVVWREALKTLQNSKSMIDVNENLTKIYKCLKLSYDNLKNEKGKELFLICSLFPKDFDISIELLCRIGIGVGLFGVVEKYCTARSKVFATIQELVDSCLLLNVEEGLVKMHDLVREVALWIANKDIQVITDLRTTIKANVRYLFWNFDDFPGLFDGTNLEILLINVDGLEDLRVPHAFFAEMTRLKILHLKCTYVHSQILDSSLLHSLQSLKSIQTLCLMNLKLGNISIFGNLPSLVSLELNLCSIIELPEEILGLKKLRLLEIRECKVKMNNPFEVIERCSQLEELYFVDNGNYINESMVPQNFSPPTLQRYQISFFELLDEYEKYGLISRYFLPHDLRHVISEGTFKKLVGTAEFLTLGGYEGTRWRNLVPDIVSVEDTGMNDLIILHMYSWPDIHCLIDTRNHYFGVIAFSKLIELHLFEMDIEDLCCGSLPSGFLEQLEIMELKTCPKLHNLLFNGKLNLCHLKVMELKDCVALTSIFQPSTAQSLVLLEELTINDCHALEYIVLDDDSGDEIVGGCDQRSLDSAFPKLKTLRIARCGNLEMILPVLFARGIPPLEAISVSDCEKLKYMFGQYREENNVLFQNEQAAMLPFLKEMKLSSVPSFIGICQEYCKLMSSFVQGPSSSVLKDSPKEKLPNPDTCAFSCARVCCFPHESKADTSKETEASATISKEKSLDLTVPLGLRDTAQCIVTQLFHFRNIKKMKLSNFANLLSLFSLSIASMILWEELTIEKWDDLKNMITNEADDHNDLTNYRSIFPKLEKLEIWDCKELEFLFPSTLFGGLKNLKSLTIKNAPELKYIFGKYPHQDNLLNQKQHVDLEFVFPALEVLCLGDVPKIISICAMSYYLTWPSLQIVVLENCNIKSFTDLMLCSDEGQLRWKTIKELHALGGEIRPLHAAQNPQLQPLNNIRTMKLVNCSNLISLLALSIASKFFLEILIIEECHELKCIVADEDDVQALMNYKTIFSKLKELHVLRCRAVEYLFPASVFKSPTHLKYMTIADAPKLKYVFGTSHQEDSLSHENQNIETCIDFPALESLCLEVVPNLVSIFPKNYHTRGLSLKSIVLDMSPKFVVKSFADFMIGWHASQHDSTTTKVKEKRFQTLTDLKVHDSKIEDIFNLTHLKVEKNRGGLELVTSSLEYLTLQNLSELRNICEGPKYTLSLNNLKKLKIMACKRLKTVFSISILRSLPELWKLEILDCEELVNIVDEENTGDHLSHEPCFPKLYELHVKSCNRLKYLFSVSVSGFLPNLMFLSIKEASKLEHVLMRRGEMKEMVMMDVLPELYSLHFEELPSLVGVCHGIDFQAVRISSEVYNCPKFAFHEISPTLLQAGLENLDSEVWAAENKHFSSHIDAHQCGKREAEGRQDLETQESSIGLPRGINEETKEIDEENLISEMPTTESLSYDSESIGQLTNKLGYSRVLDGSKSGRTISANQLTDLESSNAVSTRPDVILSPDISLKVGEVIAEEGPTLETLHPFLFNSNSTEKALVPMSPILIALPTEGSTFTVTKIFEKEEEEEGGLITTRHRQSDIKEVISPITEDLQLICGGAPLSLVNALLPETSVQGDHFVPPTVMIVSEQASEKISSLSLVPSKFSMSLEQTLPLTPSKPICEEKDQDDVGATNQQTKRVLDTIQVSSKSTALAIVPSKGGNVEPTFLEHVGDETIEEASVVRNECEANLTCSNDVSVFEVRDSRACSSNELLRDDASKHGGQVNRSGDVGADLSPFEGTEHGPSYSKGTTPPFSRTDYALTVPGVQEIVEMMNLEGVESFMLAKAFESHPQLRLSPKNRSTRMLCFSYRVLLDILNILATRTPLSITDADKRSLAENLKDASILGFDINWLDSIKTKVFGCDLSKAYHALEVLKGLGNELNAIEEELTTICGEEEGAALAMQAAQKELEAAQFHFDSVQCEHANIKAHHSQLLEARIRILDQQDECWETISAKDRHFGL